MVIKITPNMERYIPTELEKGWGILDRLTGEILKREQKNRIERYWFKKWAINRCVQLNKGKTK